MFRVHPALGTLLVFIPEGADGPPRIVALLVALGAIVGDGYLASDPVRGRPLRSWASPARWRA